MQIGILITQNGLLSTENSAFMLSVVQVQSAHTSLAKLSRTHPKKEKKKKAIENFQRYS